MTTTGLSTTNFGELNAARVHAAHRDIAQRWLERLQAVLPVEPEEIFPSDQLLDHMPALIREIADYLSAELASDLIADTHVFSKARALGELRFEQRASVHQLLREYRILAAVLGTFIQEQFDALDVPAQPLDAARVANRLSDAVFILLQTTTDTFVGRYTDTIDEQTTRLEGFEFGEVSLIDVDGDGQLHLAVRDNGLGTRAQDRPDVFRRFFCGHASRDEELGNDGAGLGLAIVAECVKTLRGRIAFESAEGADTTFTIMLPTEADLKVRPTY